MLPPYLEPTYSLIFKTFPDGNWGRLYYPMLKFLADHMSQKSLADVIAAGTGRDYDTIYNEVLYAGSIDVPAEDTEAVRSKLQPNGLQAWLEE